MDILSLFIIVLLGSALALFAIFLPMAIVFNVKAGRKYRQALAEKVETLRLSKMLAALGIDINEYLSKERAVDIYQHMERCDACGDTEQCDERLVQNDIHADDIGFCNNEQSLQKILEKNRPGVSIRQ